MVGGVHPQVYIAGGGKMLQYGLSAYTGAPHLGQLPVCVYPISHTPFLFSGIGHVPRQD